LHLPSIERREGVILLLKRFEEKRGGFLTSPCKGEGRKIPYGRPGTPRKRQKLVKGKALGKKEAYGVRLGKNGEHLTSLEPSGEKR